MKNTQTERDARERMGPGHITAQGFLGRDTRSLADIVEADDEAWRRAGIEPEAAADFLERLRDLGQKGLGEPTSVDGRWLVTAGDARGLLPCPWNDGTFHKNSIAVRDLKTGAELAYSDLSIHLLRTHRFCQGKGGAFRLEPETIAAMMG